MEWVRRNGYGIATSVGMVTWEVVLYAASKLDLPVLVYVPCTAPSPHETATRVLIEFGLDRSRTAFVLLPAESRGSPKRGWPPRDEFVTRSARVLVPVSVRPNGNLARLLEKHPRSGINVDFAVPYAPCARHENCTPSLWTPNDQLHGRTWPYLVHYTRTRHGPWPGEESSSFYADLIASRDEYPRNAMATLRRILSMRKLIGSSNHLRGGTRAVAFTEVHPCDALGLMRWRKRFVRWSFEPYGIGINKSWGEVSGLRPVHYGTRHDYAALSNAERPFFQNQGMQSDWLPEREWRWLGDLDLNDVPPDMLCALARTEAEAAETTAAFGIRTFAICQ